MRKLFILSALALLCFASCKKDDDSGNNNNNNNNNTTSGEPRAGSKWTYKITQFNEAGTATGSQTVGFTAADTTIAGNTYVVLKESSSNMPNRILQKKTDGWWSMPLPSTNISMFFKTTAAVGDWYLMAISDNTIDTARVRSLNQSVTVPAGTFNCQFVEGYDTNSKEDEYYFNADNGLVIRQGTFDARTAGSGMYEKQRLELVSFQR